MDKSKASEVAELLVNNQKPAIGLDIGTYTLVQARRTSQGKVQFRTEINGFIEVPNDLSTKVMLGMFKKQGIPSYQPEGGKIVYLMGKRALEIAHGLSSIQRLGGGKGIFRRTMKEGLMSVEDSRETFNLLAVMLRSLCAPLPCERCPIAFSLPAAPINRDGVTPQYHAKVMGKILETVDGVKADPFAINEAQAIIYAECEQENFTGLGMSWGAGMTNVCFSIMGMPVFEFSVVGGGDRIDNGAAQSSGVDPVVVNQMKMGDDETPGVDLTSEPTGSDAHIHRAIINHYEILIEEVVTNVSRHIREQKHRVSAAHRPSVVVAGGTSSPKGFIELLTRRLNEADFGDFKLGDIRMAGQGDVGDDGQPLPNPQLYTVAKGLLRAAEVLERG